MNKIPWFAQLTPKAMSKEWDKLIVQRSDESWDRETYETHLADLLDKYGFRFRNDDDTLYEAQKIWEQRYNESDLDEQF